MGYTVYSNGAKKLRSSFYEVIRSLILLLHMPTSIESSIFKGSCYLRVLSPLTYHAHVCSQSVPFMIHLFDVALFLCEVPSFSIWSLRDSGWVSVEVWSSCENAVSFLLGIPFAFFGISSLCGVYWLFYLIMLSSDLWGRAWSTMVGSHPWKMSHYGC